MCSNSEVPCCYVILVRMMLTSLCSARMFFLVTRLSHAAQLSVFDLQSALLQDLMSSSDIHLDLTEDVRTIFRDLFTDIAAMHETVST
jgi:hypothetical protein